jgi:hypothetical protein
LHLCVLLPVLTPIEAAKERVLALLLLLFLLLLLCISLILLSVVVMLLLDSISFLVAAVVHPIF